eukprot:610051-Rhodomonas_salina.1
MMTRLALPWGEGVMIAEHLIPRLHAMCLRCQPTGTGPNVAIQLALDLFRVPEIEFVPLAKELAQWTDWEQDPRTSGDALIGKLVDPYLLAALRGQAATVRGEVVGQEEQGAMSGQQVEDRQRDTVAA